MFFATTAEIAAWGAVAIALVGAIANAIVTVISHTQTRKQMNGTVEKAVEATFKQSEEAKTVAKDDSLARETAAYERGLKEAKETDEAANKALFRDGNGPHHPLDSITEENFGRKD